MVEAVRKMKLLEEKGDQGTESLNFGKDTYIKTNVVRFMLED